MQQPSPSPVRCEELWYEDGTVVLRAGNFLYRVYSGMLSRESAFFRSMFSLPQAGDGGERYEGLPFVHLPDHEYEVTEFLKAIHYPRYADKMVAENMDILAALLRLGSKYDVPTLRALSVATLEASCPSTLGAWWSLQQGTRILRYADDYKIMLHLARECNVPHVVPVCLWQLQPMEPSHHALRQLREPVVSSATGIEYRLDEATISTMLVAIWKCIERYAAIAPQVFIKSDSCLIDEDCTYELGHVRENFSRDYRDILLPMEHIRALEMASQCEECDVRNNAKWISLATATWNMLPEFYDLPPWDDLRASLAAEE